MDFIILVIFSFSVFLHLEYIGKSGGMITLGQLLIYNFIRYTIIIQLLLNLFGYIATFLISAISMRIQIQDYGYRLDSFGVTGYLIFLDNIIYIPYYMYLFYMGFMILFGPHELIEKHYKLKKVPNDKYEMIKKKLKNIQLKYNKNRSINMILLPTKIFYKPHTFPKKLRALAFGNQNGKHNLILDDVLINNINEKKATRQDEFILFHEISHVANGDISLSSTLQLLGRYRYILKILVFLFITTVIRIMMLIYVKYSNIPERNLPDLFTSPFFNLRMKFILNDLINKSLTIIISWVMLYLILSYIKNNSEILANIRSCSLLSFNSAYLDFNERLSDHCKKFVSEIQKDNRYIKDIGILIVTCFKDFVLRKKESKICYLPYGRGFVITSFASLKNKENRKSFTQDSQD